MTVQVIALLVNAIFAIPSLQWSPSNEISHLELFAGDCAVTRGEFQDELENLCLSTAVQTDVN